MQVLPDEQFTPNGQSLFRQYIFYPKTQQSNLREFYTYLKGVLDQSQKSQYVIAEHNSGEDSESCEPREHVHVLLQTNTNKERGFIGKFKGGEEITIGEYTWGHKYRKYKGREDWVRVWRYILLRREGSQGRISSVLHRKLLLSNDNNFTEVGPNRQGDRNKEFVVQRQSESEEQVTAGPGNPYFDGIQEQSEEIPRGKGGTKELRWLVKEMVNSKFKSLDHWRNSLLDLNNDYFMFMLSKETYYQKVWQTAWTFRTNYIFNLSFPDCVQRFKDQYTESDFSECLNSQDSYLCIKTIVDTFNIDPTTFVEHLLKIANREYNKCSCIQLIGPPNSGKTLLWNSLAPLFLNTETLLNCKTGSSITSDFELMQLSFKPRAVFCDEMLLSDSNLESFKLLFAREPCSVNVKHKPPSIVENLCFFISSNRELCSCVVIDKNQRQNEIEARLIKIRVTPTGESQLFFEQFLDERGNKRTVKLSPFGWLKYFDKMERYNSMFYSKPPSDLTFDDLLVN